MKCNERERESVKIFDLITDSFVFALGHGKRHCKRRRTEGYLKYLYQLLFVIRAIAKTEDARRAQCVCLMWIA
jgi:hypothetical protein